MDVPTTTGRVTIHTPPELNRRIRRQTEQRLWYYASHPDRIGERLAELDEEWDIERVLEANASSLALIGLVLGALYSRKLYIVPLAVTAFLLQHAIQGWCPPITFFRRRGFRTQSEIEAERYALKALRGDFDDGAALPADAAPQDRIRWALGAVENSAG